MRGVGRTVGSFNLPLFDVRATARESCTGGSHLPESGRGESSSPTIASPARMTARKPTPSSGESLSDISAQRGLCTCLTVHRRGTSRAVAVERASERPTECRMPESPGAQRSEHPGTERPEGACSFRRGREGATVPVTHWFNHPAQARPTPPRTGPCLLRHFSGSAGRLSGSRDGERRKPGERQ